MVDTESSDQISTIDEGKCGIQPFVGRLMNHQAELMAWRRDLPPHLALGEYKTTLIVGKWDEVPWVRLQREHIQLSKSLGVRLLSGR
jgi:hypothetical protein